MSLKIWYEKEKKNLGLQNILRHFDVESKLNEKC